MSEFRIRQATSDPQEAEELAEVTLDVVDGGASVGFLHPLSREKAVAFWRTCQASAARHERILLVAEDSGTNRIVGTVSILLAMPDNQPHRGDISKMQVHRSVRRRGLGSSLMRAAEAAALEAGKTLLVLDTVTASDADRLYTRLGWTRVGEIPEYALWPRGGFCGTTIFYRQLKDEGELDPVAPKPR
jgi:GNAT superfamily N-acetyltransferase